MLRNHKSDFMDQPTPDKNWGRPICEGHEYIRNPSTKRCVICTGIKPPAGSREDKRQLFERWSLTLGLPTYGLTYKEMCRNLINKVRSENADLDFLLYQAEEKLGSPGVTASQMRARAQMTKAIREFVGPNIDTETVVDALLALSLSSAAAPASRAVPARAPFQVPAAVPRRPGPAPVFPRPVAAPTVTQPTQPYRSMQDFGQQEQSREGKRRAAEDTKWQAPGEYDSEVEKGLTIRIDENGVATYLYNGREVGSVANVVELRALKNGGFLLKLLEPGRYAYVGRAFNPDGSTRLTRYVFRMDPSDRELLAVTNTGVVVAENNVYLPEFGFMMPKVPTWSNVAGDFQDVYVRNTKEAFANIYNGLKNRTQPILIL